MFSPLRGFCQDVLSMQQEKVKTHVATISYFYAISIQLCCSVLKGTLLNNLFFIWSFKDIYIYSFEVLNLHNVLDTIMIFVMYNFMVLFPLIFIIYFLLWYATYSLQNTYRTIFSFMFFMFCYQFPTFPAPDTTSIGFLFVFFRLSPQLQVYTLSLY